MSIPTTTVTPIENKDVNLQSRFIVKCINTPFLTIQNTAIPV